MILASRLNGIFGSYIHRDQAGFLKHRYMRDKTQLLTNIIDCIRDRGDPPLLFFLDIEKAFDRLQWDFKATQAG